MKLTATIDVGELYTIIVFDQRPGPKVYVGSLADLRPRLYKLLMEWSATFMFDKQLNEVCQSVQDKLLHSTPELAYCEYECLFLGRKKAPPISQAIWFVGVIDTEDE
jgi:hypothetical protein